MSRSIMRRCETALHGMKMISDYYGRSEATILKLYRDYGFPIRKDTGAWIGDRLLIDDWHRDFIVGSTEKWIDSPTKKTMSSPKSP